MELQKLIKKRDKVCMLLEQGEVELIKKANRKRLKELKRAPVPSQNSLIDSDLETATASSSAVDEKMRPSHRLGFLGLFGQKVDTLEWCRRELLTLLPEAEEAQARWRAGDFTKSAAVFAEFHTQHQAQIAYQVLTHHHGLSMSPKHIGVRPDEIIWENLAIPWWQLIIRQYIMYSFVATLIIFWAIPVAVVGIVAQISVLQSLPFLTWINQIPSVRFPLIPSPFFSYQYRYGETHILFVLGNPRHRRGSPPVRCASYPHVLCPHHHAIRSQARRRSLTVRGRTLHAKRLLPLPAHPGLPHPNDNRHSVICDCTDRQEPDSRLQYPGGSPPHVVQLLHLLFYYRGCDDRH